MPEMPSEPVQSCPDNTSGSRGTSSDAESSLSQLRERSEEDTLDILAGIALDRPKTVEEVHSFRPYRRLLSQPLLPADMSSFRPGKPGASALGLAVSTQVGSIAAVD